MYIQKTILVSFLNRFLLHKRYVFSLTGQLPKTKLFKDGKDGSPSVSKQIETAWKKKLKDIEKTELKNSSLFSVKDTSSKKKKYILSMFPYPSGHLHMGHVRVYTISDIIAKYYKMNGYEVLHPIGWDAFGLPAENAARERNIPADTWTHSNIDTMKKQLKIFGCNFNWECELSTCNSEYFKWTQLIFLQLYKAGLAYQQEAIVNWDPVDNTVLANEQVDSKGMSWRSGVKVEKKSLKQWFIQISKYNHELYENLDNYTLENWETVAKLQRSWIGKCNGYRVIFETVTSCGKQLSFNNIHGWVKTLDSIPNISFIGINTSHSLNRPEYHLNTIDDYILLNIKAINPITQSNIPIIVSDSFKFIKASFTQISPYYIPHEPITQDDKTILDAFNITEQKHSNYKVDNILENLISTGNGGYLCNPYSKDWLVSRQRYWGTPIPIVHCDECGVVPVPEEQLPVLLPTLSNLNSTQKLESLKDIPEWIKCSCPKCGNLAKRETDTLDTFVDSSWYFLRYTDPHNTSQPFSKDRANHFMPVDVYVGGIEHALMHLYYSRFLQLFFSKSGQVSHKEPFNTLLMIGQVKGHTYKLKRDEKYIPPDQVDKSKKPPVDKNTGKPVIHTVEKMGKSKHNGVNPIDVVNEFGVDSTRMMMVSSVHPFDPLIWNTSAHYRQFQMRLYGLVIEFFKKRNGEDPLMEEEYLTEEQLKSEIRSLLIKKNKYIALIKNNFENTLNISAVIENMVLYARMLGSETPRHLLLTDECEHALRDLLIMLAPVIPHLSHELWVMFTTHATSPYTNKELPLCKQTWPKIDHDYAPDLSQQ